MRLLSLLAGIAWALVVAATAARADGLIYDCSTVTGAAEQYICKRDDLAFLNLNIREVYAAALASSEVTMSGKQDIQHLKDAQAAWKKQRDACMQAADKSKCIVDITHQRIAYLQARYLLIKGDEPRVFVCGKDASNNLIATLFPGDLPAVRLERGDEIAAAVLTPSSTGKKYVDDEGDEFWLNGNNAEVRWPAGTKLTCRVRK